MVQCELHDPRRRDEQVVPGTGHDLPGAGHLSIARGLDLRFLGRLANSFLGSPGQRAGHLAGLTRELIYDSVVQADEILNINKAYPDNRSLLLGPASKATMLQCDKFVEAQERGDGGETLKTARLGTVLGFDTYMFQNVASCLANADVELGTVTAAHAAGSQDEQAVSITDAAQGEFCVVVGNDQPTWAQAAASGEITLNEPNAYATLAGAVISRYKACAVAAGGGRASGYGEYITLSGYTNQPQIGQLLAFGNTAATRKLYTVIESIAGTGSCQVLLDRPLEFAISAGDPAFPGPYGLFNVAMHKNCLALVTRPLATTHAAGIQFGVQEDYGVGIRVAMQHFINKGLVVAVDLLAGVAVLDTRLAVPLLG